MIDTVDMEEDNSQAQGSVQAHSQPVLMGPGPPPGLPPPPQQGGPMPPGQPPVMMPPGQYRLCSGPSLSGHAQQRPPSLM